MITSTLSSAKDAIITSSYITSTRAITVDEYIDSYIDSYMRHELKHVVDRAVAERLAKFVKERNDMEFDTSEEELMKLLNG